MGGKQGIKLNKIIGSGLANCINAGFRINMQLHKPDPLLIIRDLCVNQRSEDISCVRVIFGSGMEQS